MNENDQLPLDVFINRIRNSPDIEDLTWVLSVVHKYMTDLHETTAVLRDENKQLRDKLNDINSIRRTN